ncbi:glycohydrolase toxin TNT-related protein [uncultured Veillonella sp.]
MRVLPHCSNRKPYTIFRVLKPIDNVAASKIMPLFGEIELGTQYELP